MTDVKFLYWSSRISSCILCNSNNIKDDCRLLCVGFTQQVIPELLSAVKY